MHDRSFAQIIDEVTVPYELGDPFFGDGAPIAREKVRKLKSRFDNAKRTPRDKAKRTHPCLVVIGVVGPVARVSGHQEHQDRSIVNAKIGAS